MRAADRPLCAGQVMRSTFAFCLLLACSSSFAAAWRNDTGWRLDPGPDGTYQVFPDRGQPPPSGVSCTSGNCVAPGSKDLPGVRPPTKFQPSSGFSKGSIAAGLGAAARISPWITAGMAAYDWYRAAQMDVEPDGDVTETIDGQSPHSGKVYRLSGNTYLTSKGEFVNQASAIPACVQANLESASNSQPSYNWAIKTSPTVLPDGSGLAGGEMCRTHKTTGASNCGYPVGAGFTSRTLTQTACAFTATGKLSGLNATGGLCPAGMPSPVDPAAVPGRLANAPISDAALARVWREVLDHGGQIEDSGPASLTGPSSVPGPTSTTTRTTPSGTSEVTTSTVTNNIVYQGNTLIITTSTVTNNVDGSTTTTTEPKTDPCSVDPESLACIKLGTPPTDAPSWETKTVTYQADSLGMPAACPAPWTATIRGWSLSMSYEPACNVAPQVRAGVLALAAFMSLMLVLTAVRS